jgi:nucleotide-binding universal stress UspA family protein
MQFGNASVECVVRFGDPVTEILREAKAFGADLIAVSTVGRSGVGRVSSEASPSRSSGNPRSRSC